MFDYDKKGWLITINPTGLAAAGKAKTFALAMCLAIKKIIQKKGKR
jgi:hypothetical protein